ncbi:hypothetical protein [Streptococcus zhangguiae]|nr:hypothetical protein [Streptococcus sp. zg-70]
MLFDWAYDNYKDDIISAGTHIVKSVDKAITKAGEAVSDLFSGLGSVCN